MRIFANKSIWKKIILIFLLIISISFIQPQPVHASVGGELMKPVCDLLVGLGDGVIKIIHIGILGQDNTLLRVYEGGMGNVINIVLKAAAIAVLVITVIMAMPSILAVIGGAATAISSASITVAGIWGGAASLAAAGKALAEAGIIAGVLFFASGSFTNQIVLPLYSISPEEIFRNKIPVFDVNFVHPNSNPVNSKWLNEISIDKQYTSENTSSALSSESDIDLINKKLSTIGIEDIATFMKGANVSTLPDDGLSGANAETKEYTREINGKTYTLTVQTTADGVKYTLSPDISLDSSSGSNNIDNSNPEDNQIFGISYLLQDTISKWYYNLRIIAIVAMMSVLVYIGIRITISSAADQKAKYKELLKDWVVGMVLLFSMHYIMNFSNVAVYKLTEVFNSVNPVQMVPIFEDNINGIDGKVLSTLNEYKVPDKGADGTVLWSTAKENGKTYVEWHTNLMGAIRMKAEARKEDGNDEAFIGYSIMFLILVIYTISFCWIYLRRVVYMAFLTLIAPLVALTYPIDKANDGNAQGFNYWFKEYIFNLLIQPVHLLIYTILVSSAAELAVKHWIYSLVVLGFLITAEKILRKMFNFKAENAPGLVSGPIAAGLTMTGMRWLMGHGPKGEQNKGKSGENGDSSLGGTDKTKIRDLIGDGFGGGSSEGESVNTNSIERIGTDKIIGEAGEAPTRYTARRKNSKRKISGVRLNRAPTGQISRNNQRTSTRTRTGTSTRLTQASSSNSNSGGTWQQGLANMGHRYISNKRNKILKDAREGRTLKALGRGAVGAFGGATLGTLGLAAGIASGDPSKAFQNAAIGAAGGYKLGSGVAGYVAGDIDAEGLMEAYGRGAMGSKEYDEREARRYAEEYSSRSDVVREVMEKFDISSWTEAQQKAQELADYYGVQEGYYDVSDWKNFEKMSEQLNSKYNFGTDDKNKSRKYAVAAKKTYDNFFDEKKSRNDTEKAMSDSLGIEQNDKNLRMMSNLMYDWAKIVR